jgi:hypothetical protein
LDSDEIRQLNLAFICAVPESLPMTNATGTTAVGECTGQRIG